MALNESSRQVAYKAIYNPLDSSQYVTIPVITAICFVDGSDQFWERVWNVVNDKTNDGRQVRTVTVHNTGGPTVDTAGDIVGTFGPDPSQSLDVERLDQFTTTSGKDQFQGYVYSINNVDGEGSETVTPHFLHWKTHITRIYQGDYDDQPPNRDVFIDVEYIDQLKTLEPGPLYGPADLWAVGQERTYNLAIDQSGNPPPDNVSGNPPANIPQYNIPGWNG